MGSAENADVRNPKRFKAALSDTSVLVAKDFGGLPQISVSLYSAANSTNICIGLAHVPWLILYVAHEVRAGGLDACAEDVRASRVIEGDGPRVYFDSRDGAWQCRIRDSAGTLHRLTRVVKKRGDDKEMLSVGEYTDEKQKILKEIEEWGSKMEAM
jgi:hypothetical protein